MGILHCGQKLLYFYWYNNLMLTVIFKSSRWCRWLSRLSNTQTVSSSSLERDNFFAHRSEGLEVRNEAPDNRIRCTCVCVRVCGFILFCHHRHFDSLVAAIAATTAWGKPSLKRGAPPPLPGPILFHLK